MGSARIVTEYLTAIRQSNIIMKVYKKKSFLCDNIYLMMVQLWTLQAPLKVDMIKAPL